MASSPASCSKADCPYALSGECAEDNTPDDCPYRIKRPLIVDAIDEIDNDVPSAGQEHENGEDGEGSDDFSAAAARA